MGVRGLTRYVQHTETLWTRIQLKDGRVLIDGMALVWYLYTKSGTINCRCGGEYDQYAQAVQTFFSSFTSKGITPFVLMDGSTFTISRCEDEIRKSQRLAVGDDCDADVFVLPLMIKMAFLQELKNLRIQFAVCDGEADQELALLANHWNCPVISNDSDFFIFSLPAGYIPLSFLDLTDSEPTISARSYQRHRLANHLKISEECLPLFASLMGNDYTEEETLAPVRQALFPSTEGIRVTTRIMTFAKFISRSHSPSEALQAVLDLVPNETQKQNLKSKLEMSMSMYEISDESLRGYFEQNEIRTSLNQNKTIPAYVIRAYRNGEFPIDYIGVMVSGERMLKVQVEDTDKNSANDCSDSLRRINYGIVEGPTVTEFNRVETELVCQEISPFTGTVPGYGNIPNLKNVRDVEESLRLKLLLIVLKANTALIKSLPVEFQLYAASIRYWIFQATPRVNQKWVQALLLVHLKLLARSEDNPPPMRETRQLRVDFDINCQHGFAQWQSVISEALQLNQILVFPAPAPNISTLYSGIEAQTIVQELNKGKQAEEFVERVALYRQLYAAVTEGLADELA